MKLASSLIACLVVGSLVLACSMSPDSGESQAPSVDVSQKTDPTYCKGAACYPISSSSGMIGDPTVTEFQCPVVAPYACGPHLIPAPAPTDPAKANPYGYLCVDGCPGGGYTTYYSPCPLWYSYVCDPLGRCRCV